MALHDSARVPATTGRTPAVVFETRKVVAAAVAGSRLRDARLVVAVSGGQDSLVLLDALHSLGKELGLELVCAHFDHGLRGAESEADAEFVQRHCKALGLECILDAADPVDRLSTEEAARDARYAFLSRVAARVGTDTVALGHTATDQAETVLLNLVRGAGLPGLVAMQQDSARAINGVTLRLVRPLLSVSRRATSEYCRAIGISPRKDLSNHSVHFTRNRVRASLVPLLRTFNPQVEDALVRLAANAVQALELIDAEAGEAWSETVIEREDSVELGEAALSLPAPVLAAVVRRAVTVLRGDLRDVRQSHVDEIIALLTGRVGRLVDLPGSLQACARPDGLTIRRPGDVSPASLHGEHPVSVPGEIHLPGWIISTDLCDLDDLGAARTGRSHSNGDSTVWLDPALADGPMWVRGWLPGDRIHPLGMTGTKKVQDLFVDEKVPRQERKSIPLLVSERGVVWVAGHRIAEWAKLPDGSGRRLEVRAERHK